MSGVIFFLFFSFLQSGGASRWRDKKWQNKSTIYIRQYVQIGFVDNSDLKQNSMLTVLESIDLSTSNWNVVTKGEFESNFGTTPAEEPKINHWLNTTLKQLVFQFKPSSR